MQLQLTHKLRRMLRIGLFVTCLVFTSLLSDAQTRQKTVQNSISQTAPHLPKMTRATEGDVFYGESSSYALKQNETAILQWVKRYPGEFKAYQAAIQKYLRTAQPQSMPASARATYEDLKAQWVMIQQMNLTLETSEIKQSSN